MDDYRKADYEAHPADHGSEKARVAYEFRTPINHILGVCEMLLEDKDIPEAYREDLARIHKSGRRLIDLMGELLDGSRTSEEAQMFRLRHEMRTPVNHIIGYSELLGEDAADEGREQLVSDLGKIRAAGQRWLEFMEDYLAGSAKRTEALAAEPLSIIDALQNVSSSRSAASAAEVLNGRILVVDDDGLNRDVLARRLQRHGHQTEEVCDGQSALTLLGEHSFDLVLLDMMMPGLSGIEVLSRMKADPGMKDISVIIISALDDEAGIASCIELGAEDYLSKPFNSAVLGARIQSSLEKKRLREAERLYLARIEEEQRISESLLLNILPQSIAARLKAGEKGISDYFPEVTVLFADLVSFTAMASDNTPEDIVDMLNSIFTSFDQLTQRHGLEKIKTIGDAYMVAGGIPLPKEDHARAVASFAIDAMKELTRFNTTRSTRIGLRIGIASGPAVAGIIGSHKFIYDLWGDTVNTASRMESHGEPWRIQVSEDTWSVIKDEFEFTARGEIEVKGKGSLKTWFLEWA